MRIAYVLLALLLLPGCTTQKEKFQTWLGEFKQDAARQGISQATLDDAFADMDEPSQEVLRLDHAQPEKTRTFDQYVDHAVTEKKIAEGKLHLQSDKALLARIEAAYGVPAPVLLSLWCSESHFGEYQGNLPVVESLASLAFDGRRSAFFREQLIDALLIIQDQRMKAAELTGSWAGAMGQIQFMPSSYLKFAVDFDQDGKKDIWTSEADALASTANYLHQKGWNPAIGWGVRVDLPGKNSFTALVTAKTVKPISDWREMGVRLQEGEELPQTLPPARLVILDNDPSIAFLVFLNFDVIMDWNHSTYFATSVGLLADAIAKP